VDEQQLVAVGVAGQRRHGLGQLPEADFDSGVLQHHARGPGRRVGGVHARKVERAGPQRTLEVDPARRRATMMQEGGGPEEALLGNLALVGALRQVGVSLPGVDALRRADRDPVALRHYGSSL
jgi:hypothetical protein